MIEFAFTAALYAGLLVYLRRDYLAHQRRLSAYPLRIHVNGIRGKSTVTRLIAGVLREAGYKTLAKTTGSAAVTIDTDGVDHPIERFAPANVREQVEIIRDWEAVRAEAVVLECMAIRPRLQAWSEDRVIRSNIAVITNVREDHQELMGFSLEKIAESLANMCPHNGVLITTEENEALRRILEAAARGRGTRFIFANPRMVREKDLDRFEYVAHKENVAIGLAVADLLGIDRKAALAGMVKATPDAGVTRLQTLRLAGKKLTWINLFAVNDRESLIANMQRLAGRNDANTVRIGVLNNRRDRQRRAEQFVDIVAHDIELDWLVTFGAFERLVTRRLVARGFPAEKILNLGDEHDPALEQILTTIAGLIPEGGNGLLIGFANIHTTQAEALMDYFQHKQDPVSEVKTRPRPAALSPQGDPLAIR